MKNKVIRKSAFETNSSSTHSISIASGEFIADKLPIDEEGVCRIYPGEFGWEEEEYCDAATKASYCLVHVKCGNDNGNEELETMLQAVIANETGAKTIEFVKSGSEYNRWGSIDHQSHGTCAEAFNSYESLRQFIFNRNSYLKTDNDNH